MHNSPSHPLIYAFLLKTKAFEGIKNIIVESDVDALKLKNTLDTLAPLFKESPKEYQIVTSYTDILRIMHYPETVGIYTTQVVLHLPENTDTKNTSILQVTKDTPLTEKQLIEWLTNNGYEAKHSHDKDNTYFRQGDTITITTSRGVLQISFFWGIIEDIYLHGQPQESYTLIALSTKN